MIIVDVILLAIAAVLAVPTAVLAIEVAASLLGRRSARRSASAPAPGEERPRVAVVIPAHNEQAVLGRTLAALMPHLASRDRVLVVADNCKDDTATVARESGAVCIERTDAARRGKGYALDAGVNALRADPPEIVIFTDADVEVRQGALDELVWQVQRTGRPAQGEYLMDTQGKARSVDLVSRFAFTLKNKVRPLGLWQLGLPCPLFGAGMAFPWEAISRAPLASGDIVEDMRLGIDLARQGQAPCFCPNAQFRGVLPAAASDADAQRRRWEHGHLSVFRDAPGLLLAGVRRLDGRIMAMGIDHLVQPLTVLCAELLIVLVLSLAWYLTGGAQLSAAAAIVAGAGVGTMGLSLIVAWAAHMRGQIPAVALMGLPRYLASRIRNQVGWLFHPQREWVRTPRAGDEGHEQTTGGPDAAPGEAVQASHPAVAGGASGNGRDPASTGSPPRAVAAGDRSELAGLRQ